MTQGTQVDRRTAETIAVIRAMEEAINRHDVEAALATVTDDVVWETTTPPDGERIVGKTAVRAAFEAFLAGSTEAVFDEEEVVGLGERAVLRWTYRWVDREGKPGHVRGVDVIRVRDGKIAEMLVYVKG